MKSVFMDERWGILQQEKEKGKAITYVFKKDDVRIIYPFIKRKAGLVDNVEYFDLVTPRGYCGPWIKGDWEPNNTEVIDEFNREFTKYCAEENIIAEYIRFSPWNNQSQYFNRIYDTKFYGFIYCNDLTIDFFNLEYSSVVRRAIRKAEKSGVQVEFDTAANSIDSFMALYSFTELKYEVSDYYHFERSFIERYIEIMPENIVFANAIYENEVIVSDMILLGDDVAHYHISGGNPEFMHLQANSLLLYKSSLYAAEKGRKLFDLGRAKKESSLETYKKKFVSGGKEYPSNVGAIIRNKDIYDILVMQSGGQSEVYFPAYRR
jgi:serine/alanine adding enzyme